MNSSLAQTADFVLRRTDDAASPEATGAVSLDKARGQSHSEERPPHPLMDTRPMPDPTVSSNASEPHPQVWFSREILPHEPALRSWLKARFPSLADSDDIVQESYARLLKTPNPAAVSNGKSYLFSTARNLVLDLFRRRRNGPFVPAAVDDCDVVAEDGLGTAEAVSRAQEYELLLEAIQALPERCRLIMTLQKLHGLSNREIAEHLHLSVNTVNAQLVLGLAKCRAYLASRGMLRRTMP